MKTLTLSALLCAMMALTRAAAPPDAEDELWTEGSADQGENHIFTKPRSCPDGWTAIKGRCFFYVAQSMSWAIAERNCMSLGGHLASVHNVQEYQELQAMISMVTDQVETWIGASDAAQEGFWFWSDGTPFSFTRWCNSQPDNTGDYQHCLQMNYSDQKCWDDLWCDRQIPSVCVRNSL